jgi:hypothetical protein
MSNSKVSKCIRFVNSEIFKFKYVFICFNSVTHKPKFHLAAKAEVMKFQIAIKKYARLFILCRDPILHQGHILGSNSKDTLNWYTKWWHNCLNVYRAETVKCLVMWSWVGSVTLFSTFLNQVHDARCEYCSRKNFAVLQITCMCVCVQNSHVILIMQV